MDAVSGGLSAGETTGLAAMVGLGLVGSVHCLGMCGPLVTTYADRLDDGGPLSLGEIRQQALFNVGRTVSYTLLGGLFGAAGALVYDLAALTRVGELVRGGVGVLVGLAILAVGVGYLTRGRAVDLARGLPVVGAGSAASRRRWSRGSTDWSTGRGWSRWARYTDSCRVRCCTRPSSMPPRPARR
nr:sulfite exporter TauE/SafE family protein [Halomicroarcula sp. SHR3]